MCWVHGRKWWQCEMFDTQKARRTLVNIPPTELIYEFERVRLGFDRLAMMVQEELHPIEEEEVKDDG
ncbi:hypothetical protein Ae201684P_019300 [Aphanomyces euteiches]|nr:hypothetical protein Ae201684P_019300 [Aphanomyces euteiches]